MRLIEDALIKNGSFNAGLAGFTTYLYNDGSATYIVDSQLTDYAYDITIDDTGDQDWHIQLMQDGVNVEEGKCYKLTLKMKSSLDRKISVAIQRNGANHDDDWTPYVQNIADVVSDWTEYTYYFKMNPATEPKSDPDARLSISMGAVGGVQITDQHRIFIDDIELVEVDESEMPAEEEIPSVEPGLNMVGNGDFENGTEKWEGFGEAISPADGTLAVIDGKAIINVKDFGTEDYHFQLKHFGIVLEKGATYKVSFKGSATAARDIKVNVMSNTFDWYGGSGIELGEAMQDFEFTFTMEKDSNADAGLFISMGKTDNPANGIITLDDFSLVKLAAE